MTALLVKSMQVNVFLFSCYSSFQARCLKQVKFALLLLKVDACHRIFLRLLKAKQKSYYSLNEIDFSYNTRQYELVVVYCQWLLLS